VTKLSGTGTIARLTLLRASRDRVALFFTFALPMLIITLLSAAAQGGELIVGVVGPDDGPLARSWSPTSAAVRRSSFGGSTTSPLSNGRSAWRKCKAGSSFRWATTPQLGPAAR
jgi:hypothetical protein